MKTILIYVGLLGFFCVFCPLFLYVFKKVVVDKDRRYLGKITD